MMRWAISGYSYMLPGAASNERLKGAVTTILEVSQAWDDLDDLDDF